MTRKGLWLAATMIAGVSAPAQAATCMWTGVSGVWSSIPNWSCGAVPTMADDVIIGDGAGSAMLATTSGTNSASTLSIGTNGTLRIGSRLNVYGASQTINGVIEIGSGGYLSNSLTGRSWQVWGGSGTIKMAGGTFGGQPVGNNPITGTPWIEIGKDLLVTGWGNVGGAVLLRNRGEIRGSTPGQSLVITTISAYPGLPGQPTFENAGLMRATGVGSGDNAFLSFDTGVFGNDASGVFLADNFGWLNMRQNSTLFNLSGGVLSGGTYRVFDASRISLRSASANASVIGITSIVNATVELGQGGLLEYANTSGSGRSLESALTSIGTGGELILNGTGRGYNALTVIGKLTLGGGLGSGTVNLPSLTLSSTGVVSGFGGVALSTGGMTNNGTVLASGGTLAISSTNAASQIGGGIWASDAGATLDVSGSADTSLSVVTLRNNGALALGANSFVVSGDYQNAGFGSGGAFDRYAGVARTTGTIDAAAGTSYAILTTAGQNPGSAIDIRGVRIGDVISLAQIANTSTSSVTIRGVATSAAANFAIGGDPFAVAAGARSSVTLTAVSAGAISDTLTVRTNFANVGNQSVLIKGTAYQAAIAAAVPTSIDYGAVRVGAGGTTTALQLGNVAAASPFTEALNQTVTVTGSAAFNVSGSRGLVTGAIGGGEAFNRLVRMDTASSGAFSGQITVAGTSLAAANSGLSNLDLGTQTITVTGKVYAPALAQVSQLAVDLGYVRPGQAASGAVTITNGATGALSDQLVTSWTASRGSSAGSIADLASQQSGSLAVGIVGSPTSGVKTGTIGLAFKSRNPDMADLALASQTVHVTATVTELAKASLYQAGGSGTLTGGSNSYTINFGNVYYKAGAVQFALGLTNGDAATSYGEQLGGSWTALSGSNAYSFSAEAIGLINAGASIQTGVLSFMTGGQALGQYLASFKLTPVSHYAGLTDQQQEQIQINVIANLVAVPEPAIWLQMIVGFGLAGGIARQRRRPPFPNQV